MAVFLDPVNHGIDHGILPYSLQERIAAVATNSDPPRLVRPLEAFQLFWERLAGMDPVPGYAPPKADKPAVTFTSLTDEPSVDLVPGVETGFLWDRDETRPSSALVTVAYPTDDDRWLGTNPQLHAGVLDFQKAGQDYCCRELIRLVKLIKYRHRIKILSYFIELFAMRWLEGSHEYPAISIDDIVANAGVTWTVREPNGYLVRDAPAMLGDFARQLHHSAECGQDLVMIDLTTPEELGTVPVKAADARRLAVQFAEIADRMEAARKAADRDDPAEAIAIWKQLLEPAPKIPGQPIIPVSGCLYGTKELERLAHSNPDEPVDGLRKTMAGCTWIFAPDNRCLLVPGPGALVRDDLYPLPGRWRSDGEALNLECCRKGTGETVYRMTGTITGDSDHRLLAATIDFTGTSRTKQWHRTSSFEQLLAEAQVAHANPPDGLAGLRELGADSLAPPVVYTVNVVGHDGVRSFPAVRTELIFGQPPSTDRAPLSFTLGVGKDNVIGNITWLSSLGDNDYAREFDTKITLGEDSLVAVYTHDGLQIAVAWLTASMPFLPSSPAFGTSARMELRFTDGDVTGTVRASGTHADHSLEYRATINGYRLRPRVSPDPESWPLMDD